MDKVFKAAVENGRAPGITGHLVEEIAQSWTMILPGYAEFFQWANRENNGLHRILPATLAIHENYDDHELLNEITWFWSGERIQLKRVRDGLRHIGQAQAYPFRAPVARGYAAAKAKVSVGTNQSCRLPGLGGPDGRNRTGSQL